MTDKEIFKIYMDGFKEELWSVYDEKERSGLELSAYKLGALHTVVGAFDDLTEEEIIKEIYERV